MIILSYVIRVSGAFRKVIKISFLISESFSKHRHLPLLVHQTHCRIGNLSGSNNLLEKEFIAWNRISSTKLHPAPPGPPYAGLQHMKHCWKSRTTSLKPKQRKTSIVKVFCWTIKQIRIIQIIQLLLLLFNL
jgi:hypothetical protein